MLGKILLVISLAASVAAKCEDGVNNVIKIHDTTFGKGKIALKDIEVRTYDENKKPKCSGGKPSFGLPGHFQLTKGTLEVKEPVNDAKETIQLALTVEKDSWIIGTVCENGVSKNQFVPNEVCKFELCKLAGADVCQLLKSKTPGPVDLTKFVADHPIDIGSFPIPQLAGNWKISVNLMQGKKVVAGLRVGQKTEWLDVDAKEVGGEVNYEPVEKVPFGQTPEGHSEL